MTRSRDRPERRRCRRHRAPRGAFATLRRGLRLMPEFRRGLPVTSLLALIATAGRVVVPIAVQQTIDRGLLGARRPGHRPGPLAGAGLRAASC